MSDEELMVFEIAYHLHMPLYKLFEEMPHDELMRWFVYFERRPVGWRDDLRTSYLLQAQGSKQKGSDIFPSLKAVSRAGPSSDPMVSLKGSSLFLKMIAAVGGDKLECLNENTDKGS